MHGLIILQLTPLGCSLSGSGSLPARALSDLSLHGYAVIPNWLSRVDTSAVAADALAVDAAGLSREAGVGSNRHQDQRLDEEIRRSRMCPLVPPISNAVGHVDTRSDLIGKLNAVRDQLNSASVQLELPPLAPFQTELSYLFYPPGGFYLRHVDVPSSSDGWVPMGRRAEDGGSFSGAALRREVSLLLYLNEGWQPEWGGALRLFVPGSGSDADGSGCAEEHVDVIPTAGTLVLMRSDRIPHEVLVTRRRRHCLVGWFRSLALRPSQ